MLSSSSRSGSSVSSSAPSSSLRSPSALALSLAAATAGVVGALLFLKQKRRTHKSRAKQQQQQQSSPCQCPPEPLSAVDEEEPLSPDCATPESIASAAVQPVGDEKECVIVVDPISTGACLADVLLRAGYAVVCITTGSVSHIPPTDPNIRHDYDATLFFDDKNPTNTLTALRALPYKFLAVLPGCELGIECSDLLSEQLGLPTNGTALSEARRDKYIMQETVRAAGVRAVTQACASTWEEVERFLDWERMPIVVLKPARSAGSDGVYKCSSSSEARAAFDRISGAHNALGGVNDVVLVQEFLSGPEFVVDTISRNGVHKVVAMWQYDKRAHEDAPFVYYGQWSVGGDSELGQSLAAYAVQVLDALSVKHGAGHAEIIMTSTGPCLVEVGCRPQGCDGTFMPVADRVWGYNQVTALAHSTLSQKAFDALPMVCGAQREYSFKVDLVCSVSGVLKRIAHLEEMRALPSFVQFDLLPPAGTRMEPTRDCFVGSCGSVTLIHQDADQLEQDRQKVFELEKTMWVVE